MFNDALSISILVLGLLSSVVTGVMNIPLAWKVHKTSDTTSLSRMTIFLTMAACLIWMVYGTLTIYKGVSQNLNIAEWLSASLPILISNGTIFFIMCYLLYKKIHGDRKNKSQDQPTTI